MRRLFIEPDAIMGDKIHLTDKDQLSYLGLVLRMKKGDGLLVISGGMSYEVYIDEITKSGVTLNVLAEYPATEECGTIITLFQGLPKGAKLDEIVRKSTELGVGRIVPVLTARSVPEYRRGIPEAKLGRLRRIAEEAARQSRRIRIPEVSDALTFDAAVCELEAASYDLALILFELEETRTLKYALREHADRLAKIRRDRGARIAVFIGPEGGFENAEVDGLLVRGAESVTVGETILRTETAGPAAVAMILYEMEL